MHRVGPARALAEWAPARVAFHDVIDAVTIERRWLRLIYLGLLEIRVCAVSRPERAAAIADALHNVPAHLATGDFDESLFLDAFLARLLRDHPDLSALRDIARGED